MELFKSSRTVKSDNEASEKGIDLFKNLSGLGIVVIDDNDIILKANKVFTKMFSEVDAIGLAWEKFLQCNFKKERANKSMPQIFKYKNDIHSDFIMQTSMDRETGYRYCWVYKINSQLLNNIAQNRTMLMESKKFDVFNYLEDSIYKKSIRWENSSLKLLETTFADEAYLYSSNKDARRLIDDYVELVYSVINLKDIKSHANLILKREGQSLLISARIEDFNFQLSDFQTRLKWNGASLKLSEICHEIEHRLEELYVSVTLKNRKENDKSSLFIELNVADVDGVQWHKADNKVSDV
ncbi:hypothetical protein [Halobacteriovorax sp. YZS-1-1]